jgi:hypothetical protein
MTDDLEVRLRDSLSAARLPSAPPSLERTLAELSIEPPASLRKRRWSMLAVSVGALLLVGSVGTLLLQGRGGNGATAPVRTPQPTPLSTASPTPSPNALDGLRVFEVGELKEAMAGPNRPAGPIALRGFWTDRTIAHSCAYFPHSETNLEGFCHDGEYGITQLDEPILTSTPDHGSLPATGPALTPWIPDGIDARLFGLPIVNGQQYTPVPIVVIGHIDDPRASECAADQRQVCLDRFVIDQLVSFDPTSVPAPTPTPLPTPFPYDNPPPAPFAASDCPGDTEYAFVGWKTMSEIGMYFPDTGMKNDVVFVVITKHVIQVGDWIGDPNGPSGRFRTMGQRICFTEEWDSGMTFTTVPGTAYREYVDGTRTPIAP